MRQLQGGGNPGATVVYSACMDVKKIIEDFQDYLAPPLDTYEQFIYLYILRHSLLQGQDEIVIGFKSARRRMAFGVGEKGKPMAEHTSYEKLRSLANKGCLKILDKERDGTRIHLLLPSEMAGLIREKEAIAELSLDEMDFFEVPENRLRILQREDHACFYCLRKLTKSNYVIEHVTSRPEGNNSYRNVVAGCRECNDRKGNTSAEDFLRDLYRRGHINTKELEHRLSRLELLRNGELKPVLP